MQVYGDFGDFGVSLDVCRLCVSTFSYVSLLSAVVVTIQYFTQSKHFDSTRIQPLGPILTGFLSPQA